MATLCFNPLADAWLEEGFCADELLVNVQSARSLVSVGTTELLVVDRGTNPQSILRLYDSNGWVIKSTLVEQGGLNHGLTIHNGYVYASSATTVFRWPYQPGDTTVGAREVVIINMNADGMGGAPQGHSTRTPILDSMGRLYVAIGSNANVDPDSFRSRIRRFNLTQPFPIDFVTGEVFADGLRNEVGLAFDKHGILWGVENGADRLERDDLGGDIHNDNPAEELNRFPEEDAGKHWGYPYCWSEFELEAGIGMGRGTRWAWPTFIDDGFDDDYCRTQTLPSELSMQAHSAPLGIAFYNYSDTLPSGCYGAFPMAMDGFAFVAFHGSWNRDIPTGYKVVYIPMNSEGRVPQGEEAHDLLRHDGNGAKWSDGFRPVDVDFDDCGRLLVSSDGTRGEGAKVVRIAYQNTDPTPITPSPTPVPTSPEPTPIPTTNPTPVPTSPEPTSAPTSSPTPVPTSGTIGPLNPTPVPSSREPTAIFPTSSPTLVPSSLETTSVPTSSLTPVPISPEPTAIPTSSPTLVPNSTEPTPTATPSPTLVPTSGAIGTADPTPGTIDGGSTATPTSIASAVALDRTVQIPLFFLLIFFFRR